MPSAGAIRPGNYRDPASPLLTLFGLSASLPAEVARRQVSLLLFASPSISTHCQALPTGRQARMPPTSQARQ